MSEPVQIVLDARVIAEAVRRENAKYARQNGIACDHSYWESPRPPSSRLTIRDRLALIRKALS